jgi:hypothetical protein
MPPYATIEAARAAKAGRGFAVVRMPLSSVGSASLIVLFRFVGGMIGESLRPAVGRAVTLPDNVPNELMAKYY